ncbi:MAG TPA: hypothetical protein VFX02_00475 [Gammaproteobacteria bacterium]|nr:hypothetical protein [Gammaproteobacteria bacterium]
MKKLLFISMLLFSLNACNHFDDDDCKTNVGGCADDKYSCPGADHCYESKAACSSSGEC